METRKCSVSGMYYPGDPAHLEQFLGMVFQEAGEPDMPDASGIVSPHAGYPYSGAVAARAFAAISSSFDGTFIVIGPSHEGFMTCASKLPWETPLGIVDTDTELVEAIGVPVDERAHAGEHSIEVQVPFIKYRFPRARIAPIMMGDQSMESAKALASAIVRAVQETGREVRVVASSDFSHYVPQDLARHVDLQAIEALESLDVPEFYRRIKFLNVSACGYGPIATMVLAARALGATRGKLLSYTTSGNITGDPIVVGYAAVAAV
ncbi:AmmeMemoRadiSam system protein B [Methanofollis formosanus]|uniref:MEMO1 family protein E2N92_09770 n=1 Tax=Methanofollis formosanus TaxID=299308 RepID=A0A8G1EGZ5_9EURY|nr:AmmeMemoRadiSam system protein B [Methanofollis formosanus]QYZ79694.1 AmmeMemoRadiSam system protein B [Methanofollis formosanus]